MHSLPGRFGAMLRYRANAIDRLLTQPGAQTLHQLRRRVAVAAPEAREYIERIGRERLQPAR
jgi:hypothetical protein